MCSWISNVSIVLLLMVSQTYSNIDKCKINALGVTIDKLCGWSDWLSWDCSCCARETRPFAFRKRAICCEDGLNLDQCIRNCSYEEHSDKTYGNCTMHVCNGNVSALENCKETPPTTDMVLLPLPSRLHTVNTSAPLSTTIIPSKQTAQLSTTASVVTETTPSLTISFPSVSNAAVETSPSKKPRTSVASTILVSLLTTAPTGLTLHVPAKTANIINTSSSSTKLLDSSVFVTPTTVESATSSESKPSAPISQRSTIPTALSSTSLMSSLSSNKPSHSLPLLYSSKSTSVSPTDNVERSTVESPVSRRQSSSLSPISSSRSRSALETTIESRTQFGLSSLPSLSPTERPEKIDTSTIQHDMASTQRSKSTHNDITDHHTFKRTTGSATISGTTDISRKLILNKEQNVTVAIVGSVVGVLVIMSAAGLIIFLLMRAKVSKRNVSVHPESGSQELQSHAYKDTGNKHVHPNDV